MVWRNTMMYESNINKQSYLDPIVRICNYFQVDSGAHWGWRIIPDYEFILIVSGKFIFQTKEMRVEISKGELLCIKPLQSHYFAHLPDCGTGVIACIHSDPPDSASQKYRPLPEVKTLTDISTDFDFFNSAFAFAARKFGYKDNLNITLQQSIVKTIWLALAELSGTGATNKKLSPPTEQIIEWINNNIEKKITRKDIAEKFIYTPEHINYLFRNELGASTSQFINRQKVLKAFNLIRTNGFSVKEAAAAMGFSDQYHFSKVFKKIIGKNPSEYKL